MKYNAMVRTFTQFHATENGGNDEPNMPKDMYSDLT